jgi:hypothetical protein
VKSSKKVAICGIFGQAGASAHTRPPRLGRAEAVLAAPASTERIARCGEKIARNLRSFRPAMRILR